MAWLALGALMVAGGVLLLRTGMPGGRAHALAARDGMPGEPYALACVVSLTFGAASVLRGLLGLAA